MANVKVSLYQSIKVSGKWTFRRAPEQRLRRLSQGGYYIRFGNRMEPAGCDPAVALAALMRKKAELNFVAVGGEVKADESQAEGPKRVKVMAAVKEYLADCRDRQGKSGYGLAPKTVQAYEYRLGFLTAFSPDGCLDEVDPAFVRAFRRYLREHPHDLGDRTCYNAMQAVSSFLVRNNNMAAKPILREMSFPPRPVIPYSDFEMTTFFAACNQEERIIFKFFLHSMAREYVITPLQSIPMVKPKKSQRYTASVVFRSQPIPPHDQVDDFDRFGILLKESQKFCKRAGLHKDLILKILKSDSDWAFILKVDALMERAAKHIIHHGQIQLLRRSMRNASLDDFIDSLSMNGRTSLLKLLNAAGLPDDELGFVETTRLVRNAYAHNIEHADLSLVELIKTRSDKSWLLKHLSGIKTYEETRLLASYEKDPMFLRYCIIDSAMRFLFYAYHLTAKKRLKRRVR